MNVCMLLDCVNSSDVVDVELLYLSNATRKKMIDFYLQLEQTT